VTEKDRGRLILMKENGKRDTSVARALGIDKSTVGRIWKHYQQAGASPIITRISISNRFFLKISRAYSN